MTAAELLPTLQSAGVVLFVTEQGTLRYRGDQAAVEQWLPAIRAHKPELVELLTQAANDTHTDPIPLATATRAEVEAWLDANGETNPETRREILIGYGFDPDFLYQDSGRRTCRQCRNLDADGGCRAARRGQIPNASRHYTWPAGIDDPHRCVGFLSGAEVTR